MKQFWDQRYSSEIYVYGEEPNEFFSQNLSGLQPGMLLLPGEGEGRNAIWAAKLGWEVTAVDYSEQARLKAQKLAAKNRVDIRYDNIPLNDFHPEVLYDVIGLVFIHLPPEDRIRFHRKMMDSLKTGGRVIAELFHKDQLKNNSGGPPNLDLLVSEEELMSDFHGLEFELLEHRQVHLDEGPFHQGLADVVRLIAKKG